MYLFIWFMRMLVGTVLLRHARRLVGGSPAKWPNSGMTTFLSIPLANYLMPMIATAYLRPGLPWLALVFGLSAAATTIVIIFLLTGEDGSDTSFWASLVLAMLLVGAFFALDTAFLTLANQDSEIN